MDNSIKFLTENYNTIGDTIEKSSESLEGENKDSALLGLAYLDVISSTLIGILEELRKPK